MFEEIAQGVARFLGRVVLEAAFRVVVQLLCFSLGFWTLRALTLGRDPVSMPELTEAQVQLCQVVGIFEIVAPIATCAYLRLAI